MPTLRPTTLVPGRLDRLEPRGRPVGLPPRPSASMKRAAGVSSSAMAERLSPTLKAVSDAVLAVASELSVEEVLQRLVHGARELAAARFAALGLPDGDGG